MKPEALNIEQLLRCLTTNGYNVSFGYLPQEGLYSVEIDKEGQVAGKGQAQRDDSDISYSLREAVVDACLRGIENNHAVDPDIFST